MNTTVKEALIVSVTPYFLEKGLVWFQENLDEIKKSSVTQPFFRDNVLLVSPGQEMSLSELLRKIDEFGYEKVFAVETPGEFSQRGGILEIFPVNARNAFRLDFLGNRIESIAVLPVAVADEEQSRQVLQKRLRRQKLFSDLAGIRPGDFLVHLDHGVGEFLRMERLPEGDYYVLGYAKGDKLYVPKELERKLSRYVGFAEPVVSRLGSVAWQKTKRKAKEDAEKTAKELLALYAKKESIARSPYRIDQLLEQELRIGFNHEETPDQAQAIADVLADLRQEKPMDRIVCGDVGFGKTEVAFRAAAAAAMNGRQVAVICPTTILAAQHEQYFKRRAESLPLKIISLSRLQSQSEQEKIIQQIAMGNLDIVVGTHRLLSKDINFKNLGLLIIDDEQRFGVKQKEVLREKYPALDLLSLSATPIPRTMYLALSSFRQISLMQTPPQGRTAIETHIASYSAEKIHQVIEAELSRGGQVYFLHNRVETMGQTISRWRERMPQVRIEGIHGRMSEPQLMKIMESFSAGNIDVLMATTIIENGIDLPKVNTIIIEDASRLGLAQAYQIRGRVGRSNIQSFAWFFHPKKMTEMAEERLKAISEINDLGAGYRIAVKDLEMRGAGNVLGREQSGAINRIGLNLYCQMLAEAVETGNNEAWKS